MTQLVREESVSGAESRLRRRVVLVVGSRPECRFPTDSPQIIYTANGAAARLGLGPWSKGSFHHVAVCGGGGGGILLPEIGERVIESRPDRLVLLRTEKYDLRQYWEGAANIDNVEFWTHEEQASLQIQVLGRRVVFADVACNIFATLKGSQGAMSWLSLLKYILVCPVRRRIHGVSTGMFSVLLAAIENPEATLVMAGIGWEEGGHFYKGAQFLGQHACTDRTAIGYLPRDLRSRLYTADKDVAEKGKLPYFA